MLIHVPPSTRGDEGQKAKSIPGFDAVREKLEGLFQKHYPKASSTSPRVSSIRFEYEVTTFEFPYTGRKGAKHESETQRGPKKGGILCVVGGQQGPYRGQLALGGFKGGVAQHFIDRKEYRQLLMAPYSQKSDVHLWVSLSYPPDADKEFLEKFLQIMVEFQQAAE